MITEALISWVTGFIGWIVERFAVPEVPSWLTGAPAQISDLGAKLAGTGQWIPWEIAQTVLSAVALCIAAGITVKLVRIVASFLTAGGGSAA